MNIKTLIIHLERAVDRKPRVKSLLALAPTEAAIINAVDGLILQPEDFAAHYQRKLFAPQYPFLLHTSEIACFLSHRKAWQTIIDLDLDAGLILEDDVSIDEVKFPMAWELACKHMQPTDYIRFPFQTREKPFSVIANNGRSSLSTPRTTGLGAQAQLVGRKAAEELLGATKRFDRPVDTFLQMTWVTNVRPKFVSPSGISENSADDGGSLIQKKRSVNLQKLHAEIARPIYRIKLANLARVNRNNTL